MLQLRTFGGLAIGQDGAAARGAGAQGRPLAVLAQLAVAGDRGLSRSKLVALLWPESDEEKARRVLAQTLYSLRRDLGADDLVVGSSELRLNPAAITTDVGDFSAAIARQAPGDAVARYAGPFLDGFYLSGAPEFERWVEETRSAFAVRCAGALDRLARDAEAAGEWTQAVEWRCRLAALDPLSPRYAAGLMRALSVVGNRAGALQHARVHAAALRAQLDLELEPEVASLAEAIRRGGVFVAGRTPDREVFSSAAGGGRGAGGPPHREDVGVIADIDHRRATSGILSLPPIAENANELVPPAVSASASPRSSRRWWGSIAATIALVGIAVGATLQRSTDRHATVDASSAAAARPVVAVADVRSDLPDTSVAWLARGITDMIASALMRSGGPVDVTPPAQLRDVLRRGGHDGGDITLSVLRDAGRRVGASLVATGELSQVDGSLVLHLGVYEVGTGRLLGLSEIIGVSALAVADAAAANVYQAAGRTLPGPVVADVGTTSIDAYRQLQRAIIANDVGKSDVVVAALDSAIARDSGFVAAIQMRLDVAMDWQPPAGSVERYRELFRRHADRATEWDRLYEDARTAYFDGDVARGEALGEQLVARWPRDTRGHALLRRFYEEDGRADAAERVAMAALALDSLGMEAGEGPCAPCAGYGGLTVARLAQGNDSGALAAARRWVALQGENSNAWLNLGVALQTTQHYDSALVALHRGEVLTGGSAVFWRARVRTLLMMRRLDDADAEIRAALDDAGRRRDDRRRLDALDLRSLLERERGQIRAELRTIEQIERLPGGPEGGLMLVHAHALGRLGEYGRAERELEHGIAGPSHPTFPVSGATARAFAWRHALLADATVGERDTVRLRAFADSIEIAAGRSYYGRDRRLPHHVRGLLAEARGDWPAAVREFTAAQWPTKPWPRTSIELARALLAIGRARDAVTVLRLAYRTDLDAMARYAGRSELDWWMGRAFAAAGEVDSARIYDGYARAAWRSADPEFIVMVTGEAQAGRERRSRR